MTADTKYKLLCALYNEIQAAYVIILDQYIDPEDIKLGKYSEELLSEACFWLETHIWHIIQNHNLPVNIPEIMGGPDGSIDLIWQESKYRILININDKGDISIYGDNLHNTPRIIIKSRNGLSIKSSWEDLESVSNELYKLQTYFIL